MVSVVVLCCVACDPPIAHNRESAIICSQRKYAQVWKLVAELYQWWELASHYGFELALLVCSWE